MKHFYRALRFFKAGHLDKSVSLRAMGVAVVDNVDVTHRSYSFEKIFEIALSGIVGKISDVEAGGLKFGGVWGLARSFPFTAIFSVPCIALWWAGLAFIFIALRSRAALTLDGLRFPKSEEVEKFIPEGDGLRSGTAAARFAVFPVTIVIPVSLFARRTFSTFVIRVLIVVPIPVSITVPISIAVPIFVRVIIILTSLRGVVRRFFIW